MNAAVRCMNGCGRTWARDPVLEVRCPTCGAIGRRCMRPSEHPIFGKGFHAARDLLADREGKYGVCPLGKCGVANKDKQLSLFEGAV